METCRLHGHPNGHLVWFHECNSDVFKGYRQTSENLPFADVGIVELLADLSGWNRFLNRTSLCWENEWSLTFGVDQSVGAGQWEAAA